MCGLFGFFGAKLPAPWLVAQIGMLASRRGPDGWGIVTEFDEMRDLGRLTEPVLNDLAPSRIVLGHCRLATVLGTKRIDACQPLRVGRHVVTHNGSVRNSEQLALRHGFELSTGNDSEAIAHLLGIGSGSLAHRLQWAMDQVDSGGHFAVVALDEDGQEVQLLAHGMPLFWLVEDAGMYWCSVQPGPEWEEVQCPRF